MCYACGAELKTGEETPAEEGGEAAEGGEITCENCGTSVSSDAEMCYACGAELKKKLNEEAEAPPKKVLKKRVL